MCHTFTRRRETQGASDPCSLVKNSTFCLDWEIKKQQLLNSWQKVRFYKRKHLHASIALCGLSRRHGKTQQHLHLFITRTTDHWSFNMFPIYFFLLPHCFVTTTLSLGSMVIPILSPSFDLTFKTPLLFKDSAFWVAPKKKKGVVPFEQLGMKAAAGACSSAGRILKIDPRQHWKCRFFLHEKLTFSSHLVPFLKIKSKENVLNCNRFS